MCAEEVVTERPMPGFDQAAIDGYAVRSVDVAGVGDTGGVQVFADHGDLDGRDVLTLPVMGTIEAGARTLSRLQPRQAVRVQTGAPLPTLAGCGPAVAVDRWRNVSGAGAARGITVTRPANGRRTQRFAQRFVGAHPDQSGEHRPGRLNQ